MPVDPPEVVAVSINEKEAVPSQVVATFEALEIEEGREYILLVELPDCSPMAAISSFRKQFVEMVRERFGERVLAVVVAGELKTTLYDVSPKPKTEPSELPDPTSEEAVPRSD